MQIFYIAPKNVKQAHVNTTTKDTWKGESLEHLNAGRVSLESRDSGK